MSLYQEHLATVKQNFDQALDLVQQNKVLIYAGHSSIAFLDDNPYPYRVNPLFKYWVPVLKSPKSFIFYEQGKTPKVFLFQERDFWHTQPVVPEGSWKEAVELVFIDQVEQVQKALGQSLQGAVFLGEHAEHFTAWGIGPVNPQPFIDALHYQRAIKTNYELECMRAANLLAAKGHNAAYQAFMAGKSELEIHHQYLNAIQCHETELPYNSIVALNEHGAVLHYDKYDVTPPSESRSFLIDAGAYYQGYCADITRTYSKAPTGFYAELVAAMDEAEQAIIEEVKPGVSYYDLHVSMHHKVAALLERFNLLNISADEIYEKGYSNAFFPHGLGHFIGLQVHDVGGFLKADGTHYVRDERHSFLRLMRPIEVGQVFTVEPGLYVVDQLLEPYAGHTDFNWDRIGELRPFGGVRIEDSVVVTEHGTENLTRDAFKALQNKA